MNTKLILALALITAVACADRTEPTAPGPQIVSMGVSERNPESAALDDAVLRIIPSLADEKGSSQLAMAFDDLSQALYGDHQSISGKLSRARAALDAYVNASGEAADLAALTLALDVVAVRVERKR